MKNIYYNFEIHPSSGFGGGMETEKSLKMTLEFKKNDLVKIFFLIEFYVQSSLN